MLSTCLGAGLGALADHFWAGLLVLTTESAAPKTDVIRIGLRDIIAMFRLYKAEASERIMLVILQTSTLSPLTPEL